MKVLFNEEKMSFVVQIDHDLPIPGTVRSYAEEHGLQKKQELHFTPLTFNQGKEILKQFQNLKLSEEQQKKVRDHIMEIAEKTKWDIATTETFYHLRKKYIFPNKTVEKESIVQTMKSDGLKQFVTYINKLMNTNFESFGHITLFAKSNDPQEKTPGIGIGSEEELKSLIIKVL